MSENETTQNPQRLIPRYYVDEDAPSYVYVRDAWTDRDVRTFRARGVSLGSHHSMESAKLAAETYCSEMNAPATALEFVSRLAIWLDEGRDAEVNPGDLCEDMGRILEHYIGQLRGLQREPLDQGPLYHPAPWINR